MEPQTRRCLLFALIVVAVAAVLIFSPQLVQTILCEVLSCLCTLFFGLLCLLALLALT